jgi:hypothetical protein
MHPARDILSHNWVLNEADMSKSSSILIYYHAEKGIYTQRNGLMPRLIKKVDVTNLSEIFTEVGWRK